MSFFPPQNTKTILFLRVVVVAPLETEGNSFQLFIHEPPTTTNNAETFLQDVLLR